jgi:hypothetical protein
LLLGDNWKNKFVTKSGCSYVRNGIVVGFWYYAIHTPKHVQTWGPSSIIKSQHCSEWSLMYFVIVYMKLHAHDSLVMILNSIEVFLNVMFFTRHSCNNMPIIYQYQRRPHKIVLPVLNPTLSTKQVAQCQISQYPTFLGMIIYI